MGRSSLRCGFASWGWWHLTRTLWLRGNDASSSFSKIAPTWISICISIKILHDGCAGGRARVERHRTLSCCRPNASLLLFATTLLEQTDGQVLRRVANKVELGQHKLDLLDEFTCARRLAELYSLDKRWLELVSKDVGCFDLEYIVT